MKSIFSKKLYGLSTQFAYQHTGGRLNLIKLIIKMQTAPLNCGAVKWFDLKCAD